MIEIVAVRGSCAVGFPEIRAEEGLTVALSWLQAYFPALGKAFRSRR
jgi:hypothetical protein